ncbi:hypothetical protein PCG10_001976 [Penicillium crustosum]|uniref:Uncharacterized protein n=1 Tax=Penicillium crustosum TaxID=36656 RepID=A0A9P5GAE4_PENCR|nr:hypothetical protein PCG10_001976 [Penicillium crustosum]
MGYVLLRSIRRERLPALTINNIELDDTFYSHPKILVTALNGPAIRLSAATVTHSDLIFATPETYLLTLFASLGLVTEGGTSVAFVRRELLQTRFVNQIADTPKGDGAKFREWVLWELESRVGDHLVKASILEIKKLLREPGDHEFNDQAVKEFLGGLRKFADGVPQAEFEKIASGMKKHKL